MDLKVLLIRFLLFAFAMGAIIHPQNASVVAENPYRLMSYAEIFAPMNEFLLGGAEKEPEIRFSKETVKALRDLGIDIPDEKLREFEKNAAEWKKEYDRLGWPMPELDATSLLMSLGMGDYDYATGVWTPSSADVYAFDAEIFDIESMYTLFLQGVASIVPGFEPVDIQEQIKEYDEPVTQERKAQAAAEGRIPDEGITTVSFSINGHTYKRELGFYGDWFNDSAIEWVNEVLEQEGFEGRLLYYDDGVQMIFLLYGNDDFARKLQTIIGRPAF